jgi:catechol 2,3-dioxygenase-like lactoylglutathione lyase family enzyme
MGGAFGKAAGIQGEGRIVGERLGAVVSPVSDVARSTGFYGRLGCRMDAGFPFDNGLRAVQFTPLSTAGLASAPRRAGATHGEHEKRTGQRDENWPEWYAAYMAAEQAGTEPPR